MITSLDIALKVKYRLNKVDTQDDENISVYNIVEAFNKAQLNVVNRLYGKNNNYKSGIESIRKRVDDLKILLNSTPKILSVTKKEGYYLSEDLPKDYFHLVRTTCLASIKDCSKKEMFIYLQEESNLNTLLRNEHTNPSFEWGETIGTIAGDNIKVFTLDKFEISKIFLTYLKRPRAIDIPGYLKQDGQPSSQIDPEMPDDIIEMCIDEAVRILSGDMQNQFSNQISQQNLQMSE